MNIEVGDKVELNTGRVLLVERMRVDDPRYVSPNGVGPFVIGGLMYHEDGRFADHDSHHPMSVKRIVQKASSFTLHDLQVDMTDDVRPWKDLTDEEKGSLLLAHHEGKVIEKILDGNWTEVDPYWADNAAYRIKPEPLRETVTLMIDDGGMGGPRTIGTIELEDGQPDPASIKMEKD